MTRIPFLVASAVAGALVLGVAACSEDGSTDPGASVTVSMTTPNTDDGVLMVVVTGAGLTEVEPASSAYEVYWRAVGASETRIIVVGDIVTGPLFTATPTLGAGAEDLTATLSEVASRLDDLRPTTAGYSVSVTR